VLQEPALRPAAARSQLIRTWLRPWPARLWRRARSTDLGSGYHDSRTDSQRKTRSQIRQLEALGYTVTLTQAA
jgi:hypothetical protein